jgi:hypothetical protein
MTAAVVVIVAIATGTTEDIATGMIADGTKSRVYGR